MNMNAPGRTYTNRGAELLDGLGLSVRQIAEKLKLKAPSQVHRWLKGQEKPSPQRKADIEAEWPRVYRNAWDEPPGPPAAPVVPEATPAPVVDHDLKPANVSPASGAAAPLPAAPMETAVAQAGELSVLEEARAQIERLRLLQRKAQTDDAAVSSRVAIERELRAALAQYAALTGELTPDDEERILGSDAWARIKGKLRDTATALPDRCTRAEACEAFGRALQELETTAPGAG